MIGHPWVFQQARVYCFFFQPQPELSNAACSCLHIGGHAVHSLIPADKPQLCSQPQLLSSVKVSQVLCKGNPPCRELGWRTDQYGLVGTPLGSKAAGEPLKDRGICRSDQGTRVSGALGSWTTDRVGTLWTCLQPRAPESQAVGSINPGLQALLELEEAYKPFSESLCSTSTLSWELWSMLQVCSMTKITSAEAFVFSCFVWKAIQHSFKILCCVLPI